MKTQTAIEGGRERLIINLRPDLKALLRAMGEKEQVSMALLVERALDSWAKKVKV